jgi:hypothetical protein
MGASASDESYIRDISASFFLLCFPARDAWLELPPAPEII